MLLLGELGRFWVRISKRYVSLMPAAFVSAQVIEDSFNVLPSWVQFFRGGVEVKMSVFVSLPQFCYILRINVGCLHQWKLLLPRGKL